MNDEIEALFESSPGIEATFSHGVTEVASAFDSLQINLLENSVLDSTDVSVERSTIIGDETLHLSEAEKFDQEVDDISKVGRDIKGMTTTEEDGLKSRGMTTNDFIENEHSSNDGVKSQSIMSNDMANGEICDIKPYNERNLPPEELCMEINIDECEETYDFSVLEGDKDKTEQRSSEKPMMARHGEERVTEENNVGELMIGECDNKLADCDDNYFATCVENKDYIEEFSRKIESLDSLIEKENQKRSSKRMQRNTKLICIQRNDKVKDPEDLSSSVCSVVSESSGVYSFDHDDNHQYVTDPMPHRNIFTSMINGRETTQSMEVSLSIEADDAVTTATDDRSLIRATRGSRPMDVFTRQLAIFDDDLQRDVKCIEDENMTDLEKKEEAEANSIDEDLKRRYGMPLMQFEGLNVVGDKNRNMPAGKEDNQQMIFHRNEGEEEHNILDVNEDGYFDSRGLLDSDKYLKEKEENREASEIIIKVIGKLPLQEMTCYEIQDDGVMQPGNVDGTNNTSIVSGNKPAETKIAQNIPAKTEWNESSKERNTLPGDVVSNDELDFSELVRRLEFASVNDYSNQDCSALASNGPNINIIPPTPRKGSLSSGTMDNIESSTKQNTSFDLPDINIIPATPRRFSLNGEDSTPLESQDAKKSLDDITLEPSSPENIFECRTKPSFMRFASVPAPHINVIPPTPRRQSLDLSLDRESFPVIQIIPPTPRRQSLGSENEEPIATAYINGDIESENNKDEPSQPSLFSSFPSPLIPRVLNWLEKSVFEDGMTPVDSALEDYVIVDAVWGNKQPNAEHHKEDEQKIDKDDVSGFTIEEQLDYHRKQLPDKREVEPEIYELMINDVASEWPNLDALENFELSSTVSLKDENGNEDDNGGDNDGGYHLDEVGYKSIRIPRKGKSRDEDGKEEERREIGLEPVVVVGKDSLSDGQKNVELKKQVEQIKDRFEPVETPKMLSESKASVFHDFIEVSDEGPESRKTAKEVERGLDIQTKKNSRHKENESEVPSLFEGLFTGGETMTRNDLPEFLEGTKEVVNGARKDSSTFADIENQLKEIDAQKHALKQRQDSGVMEETTFGATCLDDLIDNETQEAMAAGMDSFYARISGCLESMHNINGLLVDGSESNNGKEDPANQLRVIII